MQLLKKVRRTLQKSAVGLYAVLLTSPVLADLPKLEDPTRGKGRGFFDTAKNYMYDAGVLAGLVIAAVALYVVASSAISTYREVTNGGKKGWGEFALQVVVGIILIIAVIWVVTKAAAIL